MLEYFVGVVCVPRTVCVLSKQQFGLLAQAVLQRFQERGVQGVIHQVALIVSKVCAYDVTCKQYVCTPYIQYNSVGCTFTVHADRLTAPYAWLDATATCFWVEYQTIACQCVEFVDCHLMVMGRRGGFSAVCHVVLL